MSVVELVAPNHYRVTYPPTCNEFGVQIDDGVSLVNIVWDRTDDTTVFRCMMHSLHLATNSSRTPPCPCIAAVLSYRKDAGLDSKPANEG